MQSRDRKVGFVPEIDDEPDKDHRLRRRDTPHYLKNKRVNKEEDAEQKVREILAQAAAQKEVAAISPIVKVWNTVLLPYITATTFFSMFVVIGNNGDC